MITAIGSLIQRVAVYESPPVAPSGETRKWVLKSDSEARFAFCCDARTVRNHIQHGGGGGVYGVVPVPGVLSLSSRSDLCQSRNKILQRASASAVRPDFGGKGAGGGGGWLPDQTPGAAGESIISGGHLHRRLLRTACGFHLTTVLLWKPPRSHYDGLLIRFDAGARWENAEPGSKNARQPHANE